MRTYRMVPKEVQQHEQDMGRICDVCREPISGRSWDETEITIMAKIGDIFPEGDFRKVQRLDLCAKHWTVARAALESALGVKCRVYDVEAYHGEPGEEVK